MTLVAAEPRGKKCINQRLRQRRANDSGTETQHIHVVVLHALPRGVRVVAHRGANAGELARGDRRARAAAADHNAALGPRAEHSLGHNPGNVGVVDRGSGAGTDIEDLVTPAGQIGRKIAFHLKSGVIGANCNPHDPILWAYGLAGLRATGSEKIRLFFRKSAARKPESPLDRLILSI